MASTKIMNSGCLIVFIIVTFYCAQSNGNHQQDIDRGKLHFIVRFVQKYSDCYYLLRIY